ncbi:hypothetical protein [Actinokineospora sp.]|uniref:hypothetical protein n=1 Tax=Actinokineospora sp. TaxID=1872133 RepID=UPI003D6ACD16
MPAAQAMSALLLAMSADRPRLRVDEMPERFLSTVRGGIGTWEAAVASFDAGGEATAALPVVEALFEPDTAIARAAAAAEDSVRFGVGKPIDQLVVGLVKVHRELVKENRRPVAMIRKAAHMERRATSRWRGAEGRKGLLVDRDLQLEEARVEVRVLLDDARAVADLMHRWRAQPVA